jgi:hypothetical protein
MAELKRICESCRHWDAERCRCLDEDNPDPEQICYPSDTCHGWQGKEENDGLLRKSQDEA